MIIVYQFGATHQNKILMPYKSLQNRSARAVRGNFDYSSSVTNIRNDLGWMNIKTSSDYFTLIIVAVYQPQL